MNTRLSPYHRPYAWLLREMAVIVLLASAACAVATTGVALPQFLILIALGVLVIARAMRMLADILAAAFCQWWPAWGMDWVS